MNIQQRIAERKRLRISAIEYEALSLIRERAETPITLKELCFYCEVTETTADEWLQGLIKKQLVAQSGKTGYVSSEFAEK